jgi:outer membrane protein
MGTRCLQTVWALVLLPVAVSAQGVSDSLTREDVVRLTLTNQPQILQAEQGLAAADARVDVTRAALYPDIVLSGLYNRIGPVPSISTDGDSFDLYPHDNYDVHVGLEQTLYDFGKKRTSVEVARAARQAFGDNLEWVKSNLAYEAVTAFNNILILQATIAVIDSQVAALQQHAAVSTKRIQAGTATNYDTLTTQVRIAVAQNERIDVVRAMSNQYILLHQLTGRPDSLPFSVKGELASAAPAPTFDSAMGAAEQQRSELILARDAEQVAATQLRLAELGNRPTFSLLATTGVKNGYIPELAEPTLNYSAGLLLRMPVFNGYRTHYEQVAARAVLESARQHTADVRRKVSTEVKQALLNIETGLSKIATTDVQIRQAEQAVAMASTRYEAGVITNVEVLDVQTSLLQTRLIRLRAFYDYSVGIVALGRATGHHLW